MFILGLVLFHPPLLAVFGQRGMLGDFPVLFLYIFAAWAAVIAGLAGATLRGAARRRDGGD